MKLRHRDPLISVARDEGWLLWISPFWAGHRPIAFWVRRRWPCVQVWRSEDCDCSRCFTDEEFYSGNQDWELPWEVRSTEVDA